MIKGSIFLLVKPTHECNLNCSYCYDEKEKKEVCDKIIKDDTMKQLIKKANNSFKDIRWTWHGGEPLLIPMEKYEEWHKEIKKQNKFGNSITFNMQSNGFLLDKTKEEKMKELSINYSISYDITNNNENRNPDKLLHEIDPYSKYGVINVIDFESSFRLIETYEKLKNTKRSVSFNKIFLDDKLRENVEEYTNNYINYYKHIIYDKDAEKKDRSFFSYLKAIFGSSDTECLCSESKCLEKFLSINPDGDVFPCDRFGKTNASHYGFGNVNKYNFSLLEYKESPGYKKIKKDINTLKKKCRGCEVSAFCNGGCLANREFNGKIDCSKVTEEECYFLKRVYTFLFNEIFNLKKEELLKINPFIYEFIFSNKVMLKFMIDEIEEV